MNYQSLCKALEKYIPEALVANVASLIAENSVLLKIKNPRTSKLGDYRSPSFNGRHTISINKNLNPYSFSITLLHELAHLLCFKKHKTRVKPHGAEWKKFFIELANPFLGKGIFPDDVEQALNTYFKNPGASTCSDPHLLKILSKYDAVPSLFLEDINEGERFELDNGRQFIKGKKRRTRFLCVCALSNREFTVSQIAKVKRIV